MIISTYFISNIWHKWTLAPLIITQSAVSIPVTELPFPAVTICNMNLAHKSAVANLLHGDEEYAVLQNICRNTVNERVINSEAGKWTTYRKVLLEVREKSFVPSFYL